MRLAIVAFAAPMPAATAVRRARINLRHMCPAALHERAACRIEHLGELIGRRARSQSAYARATCFWVAEKPRDRKICPAVARQRKLVVQLLVPLGGRDTRLMLVRTTLVGPLRWRRSVTMSLRLLPFHQARAAGAVTMLV